MTRDQAFEISGVLESLECDHDVTFRIMLHPSRCGRGWPAGPTWEHKDLARAGSLRSGHDGARRLSSNGPDRLSTRVDRDRA